MKIPYLVYFSAPCANFHKTTSWILVICKSANLGFVKTNSSYLHVSTLTTDHVNHLDIGPLCHRFIHLQSHHHKTVQAQNAMSSLAMVFTELWQSVWMLLHIEGYQSPIETDPEMCPHCNKTLTNWEKFSTMRDQPANLCHLFKRCSRNQSTFS